MGSVSASDGAFTLLVVLSTALRAVPVRPKAAGGFSGGFRTTSAVLSLFSSGLRAAFLFVGAGTGVGATGPGFVAVAALALVVRVVGGISVGFFARVDALVTALGLLDIVMVDGERVVADVQNDDHATREASRDAVDSI